MALIKCRECSHDISDEATTCPHCGLTMPAPKKRGCFSIAATIVGGFVALIIILIVINTALTLNKPKTEDIEPYDGHAALIEAMAKIPKGYDQGLLDSGDIYYIKWITPKSSQCHGETCFAVSLIMTKDCPNALYAAITLLDKNNTNIGWTNDTAQSAIKGEKITLVFNTYESNVASARLDKLSCR